MRTAGPRIAIVGAGPTGLGAAWRLHELGWRDWVLVDAADTPGGMSSSVVDPHGFTWDLGGHVLFSRYAYFDDLMDRLMGDNWVDHERESWIYARGRFIPYPLQLNLRHLPAVDLLACLDGLLAVHARPPDEPVPRTFRDWILRQFGQGLADIFMLPYNRKVWACEADTMCVGWMGAYVATVDFGRVLQNLVLQRDDLGWGPNARFRFPLRGGTGAIWRALHARLPADHIQMERRVTAVDAGARMLRFADGGTLGFDTLISTMPLDHLLRALPEQPDLTARAGDLRYSNLHVVGVGVAGSIPESLRTKCWTYFPEPDLPFYRVTVFSNYSPNNVPEPGKQWSLMCEVSESPGTPRDPEQVVEEVLEGLRKTSFLPDRGHVVSLWTRRLERGYPTPYLGRDALLQAIDLMLRRLGIWSRGRLGGWKYEVSSQDHSLMQGVEAVDHILAGTEETTYEHPEVVNAERCPPQDRGLAARLQSPLTPRLTRSLGRAAVCADGNPRRTGAPLRRLPAALPPRSRRSRRGSRGS